MSRTFRKKNYEAENQTSWDTRGRKTAGFYTHRQSWINSASREELFLPPTKEQFVTRFWEIHGESRSRNAVSPGKEYRRVRIKQNRQLTRRELHNYVDNPDYEVMVEVNPRGCWWDWD